MIQRTLEKKLKLSVTQYPIILLTGPRQSGKSTLLKEAFKDYKYVSLEDLDNRQFAIEDPRGFIETYPDTTIIDEAQRVPELFSYLQTHVDKNGGNGMYILSGSQNFLLMKNISQSLAGRVDIYTLLPFSHAELIAAGIDKEINNEIFTGGYPRIYDKGLEPDRYYRNYIQTYVERDIRLLQNIGDLNLFVKFIKLCAGRIGQLINFSSLANDCGIAVSTAQNWLSLLETSYILYQLKPEYNNFSKRLIKSPKLYFYDTGLACALLDITTPEQLEYHFLKGGLFENLVINEKMKSYYNNGKLPNLSFWRDRKGNEIDLIITENGKQKPVEIKAGHTYSEDFFTGINYWRKTTDTAADDCTVVYNGAEKRVTRNGILLPFSEFAK